MHRVDECHAHTPANLAVAALCLEAMGGTTEEPYGNGGGRL